MIGFGAEALPAIGLVIGVIAFEPDHLTVALEGEDVSGDAVEKPAVVRDDDSAAGVFEQRLLESAQHIDVEIIGRLVEQYYIRAGLQHLGDMDAVAFAARELTHLLLLVRSAEIEQCAIGAARHLAAAEVDLVPAVRDFLPHRVGRNQGVAALVDITEPDRLADPEGPFVRDLLAGDHAEEGRLAGPVRADNPDDAAGRQAEIERVDEAPTAKGF